MQVEKLFSVVILHYKQPHYWKTAVDSLLSQYYPAIQLIFIDDGSPDFQASEVEDYINTHKKGNLRSFHVIANHENQGIVKSQQQADALCTGTYLMHFAADDALPNPHVLEWYARALDSLADNEIGVFGKLIPCDHELNPSPKLEKSLPSYDECRRIAAMEPQELFRYLVLSNGNRITPGASAYMKSIYDTVSSSEGNHTILIEDWPFFLEIARNGYKMAFVEDETLLYRAGGMSTTMSNSPIHDRFLADRVSVYENEILPYISIFSSNEQADILTNYLSIKRPKEEKTIQDTFLMNLVKQNPELTSLVLQKTINKHQDLSQWTRELQEAKDYLESRCNQLESRCVQLESSRLVRFSTKLASLKLRIKNRLGRSSGS